MKLSYLEEIDELQQVSFGERECFLHKEHRWVLPIIFYNQQKKILPHPCTLVMFDAHHDTSIPACMEDIRRIKETGITFDELLNLCKEKLSNEKQKRVRSCNDIFFSYDCLLLNKCVIARPDPKAPSTSYHKPQKSLVQEFKHGHLIQNEKP